MFLPLFLFAAAMHAQSIHGLWHATVLNPAGDPVAFQLQLENGPNGLQGTLVNGSDTNSSTSASFDGSTLQLHFDYWDATLLARLDKGKLSGAFTRTYRKTTLARPFSAHREAPPLPAVQPATNLQGDWLLNTEDAKGKKDVYQAVLRQHGTRMNATLLHVTGDSGAMTGIINGDTVTLSRFDGIRATLLKLKAKPDGTLVGTMNSTDTARAHRLTANDAAAFDPGAFTRVRNPEKPLHLSFPDLTGKTVSLADPQYQGKVVLVTIMGSWCPNCHDETPFLNELYDRYRAQGLEIIAIGFEYTGETVRDLRQLKIFADKFKVRYPILYAGATEDAEKKLPQLENFGAYPTTILIGRDGLVKKVHTGFDGPATGERFTQLKHETVESIEHLLNTGSGK